MTRVQRQISAVTRQIEKTHFEHLGIKFYCLNLPSTAVSRRRVACAKSKLNKNSFSCTKKKGMERPAAILLDIGGTTTDLTSATRKLTSFMAVQANVQAYLRDTYERPETKELIKRLRETRSSAPEEEQAQLPPIVSPSSSRDKIVKSIAEYCVELLNNSSNNTSGSGGSQKTNKASSISANSTFAAVLAELTALLWCWALEEGRLVMPAYDEVTFALHAWKEGASGLRTYIFSGQQNLHQRLLLSATNHGNLEPLISGYFDTELGPTTEAASFRRILREIAQENSAPLGGKVLYITAAVKQASAALEAGLKVALIQRSSSTDSPPDGLSELKEAGALVISTFDELKFK